MSCYGHLKEAEARRHFIEHNLKVTLVLKNVTVEEIAAMMDFLKKYRQEQKT